MTAPNTLLPLLMKQVGGVGWMPTPPTSFVQACGGLNRSVIAGDCRGRAGGLRAGRFAHAQDAREPPSCTRRSSWALMATMIVLRDMNRAPMAGESRIPTGARMPAASGRATTL